jgi:hypothetical protein
MHPSHIVESIFNAPYSTHTAPKNFMCRPQRSIDAVGAGIDSSFGRSLTSKVAHGPTMHRYIYVHLMRNCCGQAHDSFRYVGRNPSVRQSLAAGS